MFNVEVKCDRCKKLISGGFDDHPLYGYTSGYYIKSSCWGKFMNGNERTICDNCMWSDKEYIKVYGNCLVS